MKFSNQYWLNSFTRALRRRLGVIVVNTIIPNLYSPFRIILEVGDAYAVVYVLTLSYVTLVTLRS